jgi:hypothetical protein
MRRAKPGDVAHVGPRRAPTFKVLVEDTLPEMKLAGCGERLPELEPVLKLEDTL